MLSTIIEKKADSVSQVKVNQQRRHEDPAVFFPGAPSDCCDSFDSAAWGHKPLLKALSA
jgi:hypothetical protein